MQRLFALALLGLGFTSAGMAEDPRPLIKASAQKTATAFLEKDWATVLDNTHPNLFRLTGGKERAQNQIAEAINQLAKQGYHISNYGVGKPTILQEEGGWKVSFVPIMMTLIGQNRRIKSDGYLMALKGPEDQRWYFLDGAMLTPQLLAAVAPPIAGKIALPPKRKPRVELIDPQQATPQPGQTTAPTNRQDWDVPAGGANMPPR